MRSEFNSKPFYLSVAQWVMEQGRWVSAKEIAEQFDIPRNKATNTVTYILSEIEDIVCETKTIPNQLEGSGCQCQRLLRIHHIGHVQSENALQDKINQHMGTLPQPATISLNKLTHEQKWQSMLSKSQRR